MDSTKSQGTLRQGPDKGVKAMGQQASPLTATSGQSFRPKQTSKLALKLVQPDSGSSTSSPYPGPEKLVAKKLPTCGAEVGIPDGPRLDTSLQENMNPSPSPYEVLKNAASSKTVEELIELIRSGKTPSERKPLNVTDVPAEDICLVGEQSGKIRWIQPSGPRDLGQGVDDEEQSILAAEATASGGALLRITLLASGFVIGEQKQQNKRAHSVSDKARLIATRGKREGITISAGPSGSSVRDISKATGADIKSWTDKSDRKHPARTFVIEGRRRAVVLAIEIICEAVQRYKELCEGAYCGQSVDRVQMVRSIEFCYQPPPRSAVPYAAALKGQSGRSPKASRRSLASSEDSDSISQFSSQSARGASGSASSSSGKRSAKDALIQHQSAGSCSLGAQLFQGSTQGTDFGDVSQTSGYSSVNQRLSFGSMVQPRESGFCSAFVYSTAAQQYDFSLLVPQDFGYSSAAYQFGYNSTTQQAFAGVPALPDYESVRQRIARASQQRNNNATPKGPKSEQPPKDEAGQGSNPADSQQSDAAAAKEADGKTEALDSRDERLVPHASKIDTAWPALPQGYVLIPPNFMVTVESLRKAGYATLGDAISTLTNKVDPHTYGFSLAGTSGYNAGFTNFGQGTQVLPNHVAITNPLEVIRVPNLNLHPNAVAYNPATFSASSEIPVEVENPMPWIQGSHPLLQAEELDVPDSRARNLREAWGW